ncbi:AMP-binding protein [Moritella yayanosii]|uniref:Putative Long-chain acyl-CoA synthetases (AMP-forming) n=1 Tax=Moritella yayanosii TaxID=69539 RepID=A0A330LSX2_9GAMM|nr:AMP-binding protein [Moritella yayanosii]SQD79789.1 putative Long-chain acyl-CoA synthetases (AMP-forming) [Moritella yayanosii]
MLTIKNVLFSKLEQREDHEIVIEKAQLKVTVKQLQERLSLLEQSYAHLDLTGKIVCLTHADPVQYMIFDLFLLKVGAVNMTVPLEFSDTQIAHFFENADYCIVDNDNVYTRLQKINQSVVFLDNNGKQINPGQPLRNNGNRDPSWRKIVHTSGTTSNPKGAIVNEQALANMLDKLTDGICAENSLNYFSFQPMSLLIEQILALYLPLVSGGKVIFKPDHVPAFGLTYTDSDTYLELIRHADANFYFLPPRLIEDLSVQALHLQEKGIDPKAYFFPQNDTYVLTGGGTVNQEATEFLDEMGICVYEGYGVSENTSVISLNTRLCRKKGTVGKPLKHTQVEIIDGEIAIRSNSLFCGYLDGEKVNNPVKNGLFFTGDIGSLDDDGYLRISGRKKNIIILSSARNICPEHVESVYRGSELIEQIVIFGDGKDYLSGIIVPANDKVTKAELDLSIKALSNELPSFSQLNNYLIPKDRNAFMTEYFTITGRPRRDVIEACIKHNLINFTTNL